MFNGNMTQAERYFDKLNNLDPGQVHFKWDWSREGGILS
jgi:hypothetical protein